MKKFYAIINLEDSDMDFSFYKNGEGAAIDDGVEISAEGDTAEEAWANLVNTYKVGAHGRMSYLHPDQLGESYGHVHYVHQLLTRDLPKAIRERGLIDCGDNVEEYVGDDGCFTTTLQGNWDMNISITHEPPVVKIEESEGDRVIEHGPYKFILSKDNYNIAIQFNGGDIVWIDNYYLNQKPEEMPKGSESCAGKPQVVITPCKGDDAAVVVSIDEETVLVNDINWEIAKDNRNKETT